MGHLVKIGRREVGPGHPTFILAEAGTNHLGDVHKAINLVKAAHLAGCDGIKFQLFTPGNDLFCPMEGDERRQERWDRSSMSSNDWLDVRDNAYASGLAFVVSVFQEDAIKLANTLELDAVKVASRAAPTFPWVQCKKGPFIISNGAGHTPGLPVYSLVLDCVMEYPAPLKKCFWDPCGRTGTSWLTDGISDHSGTVWPAIDACFKGAALVEVHFALDKTSAGLDAPVCLSPNQLKLICEARDAAAEMQTD